MSYNRATDFYSGVSAAMLAESRTCMFIGGASEPTALVAKQARELGFKGGFIIIDQAKIDEMAKVIGGLGAARRLDRRDAAGERHPSGSRRLHRALSQAEPGQGS